MMWDASTPPPPSPLTVLGRHGQKLKIRVFGLTKIMTREQVIALAKDRRKVGAMVQLSGLIREDEIA